MVQFAAPAREFGLGAQLTRQEQFIDCFAEQIAVLLVLTFVVPAPVDEFAAPTVVPARPWPCSRSPVSKRKPLEKRRKFRIRRDRAKKSSFQFGRIPGVGALGAAPGPRVGTEGSTAKTKDGREANHARGRGNTPIPIRVPLGFSREVVIEESPGTPCMLFRTLDFGHKMGHRHIMDAAPLRTLNAAEEAAWSSLFHRIVLLTRNV